MLHPRYPLDEDERWKESVDPLAEFIFETTHLNSLESEQLARAILDLVRSE